MKGSNEVEVLVNQDESELIRPIAVEAREGFRIWLEYSDGVAGEVDLAHLAGRGVFQVWNERATFETVHLVPTGGIAWSDEIELCPDSLYIQLTGNSVTEVMPRTVLLVENA